MPARVFNQGAEGCKTSAGLPPTISKEQTVYWVVLYLNSKHHFKYSFDWMPWYQSQSNKNQRHFGRSTFVYFQIFHGVCSRLSLQSCSLADWHGQVTGQETKVKVLHIWILVNWSMDARIDFAHQLICQSIPDLFPWHRDWLESLNWSKMNWGPRHAWQLKASRRSSQYAGWCHRVHTWR